MLPIVKAVSRLEMEQLLASGALDAPGVFCISIIDSRATALFNTADRKALTLRFDDMAPDMCDSDEHFALLLKQRQELGHPFVLFDNSSADEIVQFVERNLDDCNLLYVHCTMGVRRSGAVAQFLCEKLGLDEVKFRADNPNIAPNPLVLFILRQHK
jgi:predicted protein tyrosine phosphatase